MMKPKLFKTTWEKRLVGLLVSPVTLCVDSSRIFQLSLVSTEAPTKVQNTLKEVEELSQKLVTLEDQYSNLKIEAKSHLTSVDTFLSNFDSQLQEIERLELEFAYLKCVKTVEELRYLKLSFLSSNRISIIISHWIVLVRNYSTAYSLIKIWKLLSSTISWFNITAC